MDAELRATFLLLLRPVLLGDQDFLFEALDVGREAYILVSGRLEVRRYVNQFGHMESDEAPIDTPGEMIGEAGLLDDGPPFRFFSVLSCGSSELLELSKEHFDAHIREDFPDIYKVFYEMGLSRITERGSREAAIAMRGRSIRRTAILKTHVKKDPITGKSAFENQSAHICVEGGLLSTLKHLNKSHIQTDLHDAGGSKTISAAIKRLPSEAQRASPLDGGETTTTSLEMRVQKIENAMHDLTSLVRQIHTKVMDS